MCSHQSRTAITSRSVFPVQLVPRGGRQLAGHMSLLLVLYSLLLLQGFSIAGGVSEVGRDAEEEQYQRSLLVAPANRRTQREAMQSWSKALTSRDYDPQYWPKLLGEGIQYSLTYLFLLPFRLISPHIFCTHTCISGEKSGPPQYFDYYIVKLSKIFSQYNAHVNFVSIGQYSNKLYCSFSIVHKCKLSHLYMH